MSDKLDLLTECMKELNTGERYDFRNFLVGSLSVEVDDETWKRSLRIAMGCVEKYSQRRAK